MTAEIRHKRRLRACILPACRATLASILWGCLREAGYLGFNEASDDFEALKLIILKANKQMVVSG